MEMNKNKLANLLKTGILFFGISLLLWNCETENELVDTIESINENVSIITFNELPKNIVETIPEINPKSEYQRKNDFETLNLNQEQIIKTVDSLKSSNYSLKFTLQNTQKNILYNLILGSDENGVAKQPYILKYNIENYDDVKNEEGVIDFSKMKATIEKYSYQRFLNSISSNYENRNLDDPCNTSGYDGSSNGGGSSGGGNSGGSTGGGGTGVNCSVAIWSSNGDIFAINIVCDDGTSYSLRDEDDGCGGSGGGGTSGDTGINGGGNGDASDCPNGNIVNGECVPTEDDQIINELTGKADCVYQKLKELSNGFKEAIQKFDEEFPVSHLKLTINNGLGSGVYGETQPPVNYVTEIQINGNRLTNLSDLGAATTFVHEIIHAEIFRKMLSAAQRGDLTTSTMTAQEAENYVNSLKDNFPGLYDYYVERWHPTWNHNMMANHYRTTIADMIQDFDNNRLPRSTYEAVSWVGLGKLEDNQTTVSWNNLTANEKQAIEALINQNFLDGPSNCN